MVLVLAAMSPGTPGKADDSTGEGVAQAEAPPAQVAQPSNLYKQGSYVQTRRACPLGGQCNTTTSRCSHSRGRSTGRGGPTLVARAPSRSGANGNPSMATFREPVPVGDIQPIEDGEPIPAEGYGGGTPETEWGLSDCAACGSGVGCVDDCYGGDPCWGPGAYYGGAFYPCFAPFRGRLWVRTEYLLWWTKSFRVPALVTSSTAGAPVLFQSGALGDADTNLLFGDTRLDNPARSGGRINFGYWLDSCQLVGLEATYFALGTEATSYSADAATAAIVARPFFNVDTDTQAAWPVVFPVPEEVTGSVTVRASTDLQGVEALLRRCLSKQPNYRFDFLAGYRFARLSDYLRISDTTTWTNPPGGHPAGTTVDLYDRFSTWNRFHGAELGVAAQARRYRWSLEAMMKLSLGSTHSKVFIEGATTTTEPAAAPVTDGGGLLAQGSNIGTYSQKEFSMIPELGITVGYNLTPRLRATFGYTFLYWSRVVRPGDQIDLDLDLDLAQLPPEPPAGAQRPEYRCVIDDLWAQGLNFGLDYRF